MDDNQRAINVLRRISGLSDAVVVKTFATALPTIIATLDNGEDWIIEPGPGETVLVTGPCNNMKLVSTSGEE